MRLAVSQGYQVTFLGFSLGNWSDELEEKLKNELQGVQLFYLDATRRQYAGWFSSTLTEKVSRILYKPERSSLRRTAFASSKRAVLLHRQLTQFYRQGIVFDRVIAHTLGALYPAFWFAKKCDIDFAFDVEDYHPWESTEGNSDYEVARRETILKQILPHAKYTTAAAPLITRQVKSLVPVINPQTIYNSFPKNEFVRPATPAGKKMKLVWFSQNINAGRGLEIILDAWKNLEQDFELTLIGKPDEQFYNQHISRHPGIVLKPPMAQALLHQYLAEFDIGLAIDVDSNDKNRQLVITNKILAYYQAGLYIVATDTPAQQQFVQDHPLHASVIRQDVANAVSSLLKIAASKEDIRQSAQARFEAAAAFNWENESARLVKIWNEA